MSAAVLMSLMLAVAAHADIRHEGITISAKDQVAADKAAESEALLRELESFNAAPVSLRDALAIAQQNRPGARVLDISFDGTVDPAVYRVQTSRGDRIWQDSIDARTGASIGPGVESSVADLEKEDRRLLSRLDDVRQEILDAVIVAERNTSGKAISAGLAMDRGRLQFVIACVAGSDLKEVLLEPPTVTSPSKR